MGFKNAMPSIVYKDNAAAFIGAIAARRRNINDWTALLIQTRKREQENQSGVDEVIQVLEFQFQSAEILILAIKQQNKVFVVTRNRDRQALSLIEKTVTEALDDGTLDAVIGIPLSQGFEYLCRVLKKVLDKGDRFGNVGLTRLARPSNAFLIYDEDPSAINKLRQILQSMGYVATAQDEEEFIALYREYAPNASFINFGNSGDHSRYLLKRVRQEIDPYAHLVIVGEKPTVAAVLESKKLGANGFIAKPFAHAVIYRQLVQMNNFVTQGSVPGARLS